MNIIEAKRIIRKRPKLFSEVTNQTYQDDFGNEYPSFATKISISRDTIKTNQISRLVDGKLLTGRDDGTHDCYRVTLDNMTYRPCILPDDLMQIARLIKLDLFK